jgi:hypothetical protein
MEKRTYTQQDRTDLFSEDINKFNKNKELRESGANVFRPRCYFHGYLGGKDFGVFTEITYAIYDEDLKRSDLISTNYSVPLIVNEDGEYEVGSYEDLNIHQNIKDFITKEAIEKAIEVAREVFGDDFEKMYESNRNYSNSKPVLDKYDL